MTFAKVNLAPLHTHHNPGSHYTTSGLNQTLMWHLSTRAPAITDDFPPRAGTSFTEPLSLGGFINLTLS